MVISGGDYMVNTLSIYLIVNKLLSLSLSLSRPLGGVEGVGGKYPLQTPPLPLCILRPYTRGTHSSRNIDLNKLSLCPCKLSLPHSLLTPLSLSKP